MKHGLARQALAMRAQASQAITRLAVLTTLALALASCSAPRLAFEALPMWLSWEANRTWDLDSSQSSAVRTQLGQWQGWLQREQMRPFATWLQTIRQRLREGPELSPAEVTRWRETLTQWWLPIARHLSPSLIQLAKTLTPAQIEAMRNRFEDANERWRRDVHPPSARARAARREERWNERTSWLFGELNAQQRELIRLHVRDVASFDALIEAQRLERQRRISLALAALPTNEAQFSEMLAGIWLADAENADAARQLALANDAIAARLFAAASPTQRASLDRRLGNWIEDLNLLAARAAKSS